MTVVAIGTARREVIETGTYTANLAVKSWQLCYDAGPDGISLALAGLLTIANDPPSNIEVGEIHLCNGNDTARFFSAGRDIPAGAIGAIDIEDRQAGAIIVREADPVTVFNLLEAGKPITAILSTWLDEDSPVLAIRSIHFYL